MSSTSRIWRGIEAVITRRSWKPFVRKGAWVRIPHSPFQEPVTEVAGLYFALTGVFKTMIRRELRRVLCAWKRHYTWYIRDTESSSDRTSGEVPKLAEGTPLERVQVVNSGARVQIPPSPLGLASGSDAGRRVRFWFEKTWKSSWQTESNVVLFISRPKERHRDF